MRAKIQKWGRGLAMRLPKCVAEQIGVAEGDWVKLEVSKAGLMVRSARRRYNLSDSVHKITRSNRHGEYDWGKTVHKEASL